ncbi:hypothetical protein K490DRAFT_64305 [Saccharata proteae CBS 121410]|uniref:DUF7587 domain-containing protein n=1 Tax=Saccharata proteae CBS 121410 TaxID=1314787 RepID=A0A6A5YBL2_9PEZI|nr:hypothetical protein K490DRAFT_64305 [Saccharata proteae CBS 121410]
MALVPQAPTGASLWVPQAMNFKSKKTTVSVYVPLATERPFQPPVALPFRAQNNTSKQAPEKTTRIHERKSRRDLWEEGLERSSEKRKRSYISISSDEGDDGSDDAQIINQLERAFENLGNIGVRDISQATNQLERALESLGEIEIYSIRSSPEANHDELQSSASQAEQPLQGSFQSTNQHERASKTTGDVEIYSIHSSPEASSDELQSSDDEASRSLGDPFQITKIAWSDEEKEVLCVLRRWYANTRHEMDKAFKSYFPDSPTTKRTIQGIQSYWYHMRRDYLRKRRHHRPWYDVYLDTEFEDTKGIWLGVRQKLEACAEAVGITLQRREVGSDEHLKESGPSYRKWLQTREERTPSSLRSTEMRSLSKSPLAGRCTLEPNKALQKPLQEVGETYGSRYQSESEDELTMCHSSPTARPIIPPSLTPISSGSSAPGKRPSPAILYRCYDNKSAGVNSPNGFTAGLFTGLGSKPQVPPPSSALDPLVKFFVGHHVWPQEMQRRQKLRLNESSSNESSSASSTPSSPLISVGDSLIWALHKAMESHKARREPHIAVLDGSKLSVDGTGFYPAAPIVGELKKSGSLRDMRYKAAAEYMVWGSIQKDAIIKDIDFSTFIEMISTQDTTAGGDLLRLGQFNGSSIAVVRAKFTAEGLLIDPYEGAALGRIAATLGIGPSTSNEAVQQAVFNIVQGWALTPSASSFEVMSIYFVDALLEACGKKNFADEDHKSYARLQMAFELGLSRAVEDLRKEKSRCGRKVKSQRNVRRRLFQDGE